MGRTREVVGVVASVRESGPVRRPPWGRTCPSPRRPRSGPPARRPWWRGSTPPTRPGSCRSCAGPSWAWIPPPPSTSCARWPTSRPCPPAWRGYARRCSPSSPGSPRRWRALGLAGVVAFHVAQRRREIGLRIALGATGAQVVGLLVRQGVLLAGAGAAVGLALAALLGPWLITCSSACPPWIRRSSWAFGPWWSSRRCWRPGCPRRGPSGWSQR